MADFDPVSYMMGQKAGPGGGSSTLSGLTDVDISNPTDGQTLVYNATTGKWENGSTGEGGTLIVHQSHDEEHGLYILDKTWQELADAILIRPVLLITDDDNMEYSVSSSSLQSVSMDGGSYWVGFTNGSFDADSANGYPYYQAD